MPSAPSRMAASKLASVFSGYAAEACSGRVGLDIRNLDTNNVHRDDPNILNRGLGDKNNGQSQQSTYQVGLKVTFSTNRRR